VDNSPRKCAALSGFTPHASSTKKAHATQPITAWFSSLTTDKQDAITTGTVAVLLLIKKRDKITPILLITPSAERPDAFNIQESNDLSMSAPAYINKQGVTRSICGFIDRALAIQYGITFIDKDLREGLSNLVDASIASINQPPQQIPSQHGSSPNCGPHKQRQDPSPCPTPRSGPDWLGQTSPKRKSHRQIHSDFTPEHCRPLQSLG
jgi:hypothetical protein